MRTVIVTGAAGFIGMNLVSVLLRKGYYIYAIVRPESEHNSRLTENSHLKIIYLDMRNIKNLGNYILNPCDVFVHLAWEGPRDDFELQQRNINYAVNSVEIASEIGCKRFLCTGSQAEYGLQTSVMTETTLPNPNTSYGVAKLAACYLTRHRAAQLNIEWIWGRIFSVYGKYEPSTTLVSYLMNSLKNGIVPQMTGATQNWDYLYSEDAGEAIVALTERARSGEIYNIANGNYRSLKDFSEMIKTEIAPNAVINYGNNQKDIVSLQPLVNKIKIDTGWFAKTKFIEGIKLIYNL